MELIALVVWAQGPGYGGSYGGGPDYGGGGSTAGVMVMNLCCCGFWLVATIPATEAFIPLGKSVCPMLKKT